MNPDEFVKKLPPVVGWIEQTLARYACLAKPVASLGFKRLPDYYAGDFLAGTKVVLLPIVPVPPLADLGLPEFASFQNGSYAGITFKNTYFVQSSQAHVEALHFHELVHVVQWGHLGVEGFLLTYAAGLISHGYRNSPLEAMAYDLQNYFLSSGKPYDVATDVRASLDRQFPNLMSGQVP